MRLFILLCFFRRLFICATFPFAGSISTADGSALVKLGNTTVVCGVKAVGLLVSGDCPVPN